MDFTRRQFIGVTSGAAALRPQAAQGPDRDSDDPLGVRRDFDVVRHGLYLNSAYITPVPRPVAEAARAWIGIERIERHTVALAHELREGLTALGFRLFTPPGNASSIVSLHLDRNQVRAREVLERAGIQVSFREKGAQLRVSPALFNTRDEIRQFLDSAKAFA